MELIIIIMIIIINISVAVFNPCNLLSPDRCFMSCSGPWDIPAPSRSPGGDSVPAPPSHGAGGLREVKIENKRLVPSPGRQRVSLHSWLCSQLWQEPPLTGLQSPRGCDRGSRAFQTRGFGIFVVGNTRNKSSKIHTAGGETRLCLFVCLFLLISGSGGGADPGVWSFS